MAAAIARSILSVRSIGATASLLLQKRLFSFSISKTGYVRPGTGPVYSTRSVAPAALSHSLLVTSPNLTRYNTVRCRVNRSGSSYSPLNSGSNFGDRPPTEMAPLFPGCDYKHWLIVMDKPGGEGATKQQMIDCYIQTLAKVVGSMGEGGEGLAIAPILTGKMEMVVVACRNYSSWREQIQLETQEKLANL
ncbi:unnamed protein product [Fraxinus pennsylvanica]|uniref:MORF/ORRM1/DAG-like MORF domain-containing protein n=1 Tax=Fraxinus pennsylvanica TaxID=56036 RepID=A0AAD2E0U1_9LAMI|nr:unnamed protein product [Fraxinus pennsylvanica]